MFLFGQNSSICAYSLHLVWFIHHCHIKCVLNINKTSSNSKKGFGLCKYLIYLLSDFPIKNFFRLKQMIPKRRRLCIRLCTAIRKLHQTRSCFLYKKQAHRKAHGGIQTCTNEVWRLYSQQFIHHTHQDVEQVLLRQP